MIFLGMVPLLDALVRKVGLPINSAVVRLQGEASDAVSLCTPLL
jgi:hypothetical protein